MLRPPALPVAEANRKRQMTEAAARFERIKARPAYELVAEAIERKILAGRLKPGDPVGTESELVKQFGVNRSTVREGIRLLEQSGLTSRALEPAAVDQAMDNATDADLALLASNVEKTRKVAHDPAAVAELDGEFHKLKIGRASC